MTPIINPFYFYLIEVCGTIREVAFFAGGGAVVLGAIFLFIAWTEGEDEFKNAMKKFFIAGAITLIIGLIIPSQKTAEKMLIAKYVTYENYDKGKQEVKEIVDYIFEKVEESKE